METGTNTVTDAAEVVTSAVGDVAKSALPESWRSVLNEFFNDNNVGIFLGKALLIAVTVLVMLIAVKITNRIFRRITDHMKEINKSGATLAAFLRYPVLFLIYFAAFAIIVSSIPGLNEAMTKLLAAGGVLAVVFGLAGQEALGSIASGMMILAFRPFVIGDVVNVVSQGVAGTVEEISLRHTVLRTIENKRVIIPNSTMNAAIVENADYGDKNVCLTLDIGITYESDVDQALAVLADEVGAHPDYLDLRTEEAKANGAPRVTVRVNELADSAVVLRALLWGKDNGTTFAMRADLMRRIKKRFDKEGIDIAYPHLVVMNK